MIGVKFEGRLGNQLFQFIYMKYLKSNFHFIFFFVNPHHSSIGKYFDLGWFNNMILTSTFCSYIMRILPKIFRFRDVYVHNFFAPKHPKLQNWAIYNGYYQSDWYINHTKGRIKLNLKKKFTDEFDALFSTSFHINKTVVVHIRRTDYLNYGKRDISLPIEYFKQRISEIKEIENYLVYFVSDDMDFVKNVFGIKENYIYSSNSEIIDFQLIMNADIAIISNSTFAWWAAYLSKKNNVVYAPKNWFGFRIGREHPKGIMTSKFIWCDVL